MNTLSIHIVTNNVRHDLHPTIYKIERIDLSQYIINHTRHMCIHYLTLLFDALNTYNKDDAIQSSK